ncbi:murein L,D-transpeptidase catalytic domain family protein [Flavobacterium haoranii]|uniref:L,D-transpeptidase catalytic domain n=1 Tax=Flavobacterium haoranii TaxID=683124 RepID=A0A1M6D9B5_9FLAO|nr:murein L,D-transpeptidase catalytic domain family protein [Flavobacterium haoranii]SHI69568.1 L,D-transpeptidase catalytic domain [Flavobacterium haoranii]
MIYKFLPLFLLSLMSFGTFATKVENKEDKNIKVITNTDPKLLAEKSKVAFETRCKSFYSEILADDFSLPQYESFTKAFEGYEQLKNQGKVQNEILTIVDFSLSSSEDRMWVIDMATKKVILQTLVAHGRNSGSDFANTFSNKSESYQSSLGFYLTGEVYQGKHGMSLRLDGQEYGINDNARDRAVVIHGADYVSENFIKANGRLGRSQGCPAVSYEIHKELIQLIKDKSVLFIYHPSRNYVAKSKLVS